MSNSAKSDGVNRRVFLRGSAAGVGAGVAALALPDAAAAAPAAPAGMGGGAAPAPGTLRVARTSVEYASNVLGTGAARPRLSWVLSSRGHGARQSAYQVRVATSRSGLRSKRQALWDTGRVSSASAVAVPYDGADLRPRTRYHWQVRVWDGRGRPSPWSAARWWETALPEDEPWQGGWIGSAAAEAPPGFGAASWIWSPGATSSDAPEGPRWFRAALDLPAGTQVARARIVATADDDFTLHLDGREVLHAPRQTDGWKTGRTADVTEGVRAAGGRIVLAALATNRGGASVNPGGLLVRLIVEPPSGPPRELVSGTGWRVADTEQEGWREADFDDGGWAPAAVLAPYGQGPWGANVTVAAPERPAPLLRREFTVGKAVASARLYISGLAYYEAEINGERVGRQVLDPGFTDYDKTVLYAVHDVTGHIRRGANAIGVTLGRGFFGMTTPNVWNWHRPPWHGEPRLLAQLEIEHPDGTRTTVASDGSWRLADGPTLSNSLYTGETYDARRARPGWSQPGFDDSGWQEPEPHQAPKGRLRAQPHDPIEVVETVTPVAVTEPRPGVYVVDMGRTMAGWTKLSVNAPEGTVVGMLHGERLYADGTVMAVNGHVPGGRFQLDEYVCAGGGAGGGGAETWEARFSYKGFRYVQVTGLTAQPRPEQFLGRVVHTPVARTGTFRCSKTFYEQLDQAMRRTILNNLHGIPTDTPMYEKNGWTGDAQLGTPTMAFAFGVHRLMAKWLGDIADSQNAEGQIPVIVPSGGWGFNEAAPAPEWTTVYPFLLREMYRVYGDSALVAEHWPTLVKFLDYEISQVKDGLSDSVLGDYLSPGYGGDAPEDRRLTGTAYLYRGLVAGAELGELLGHSDTAARYRTRAKACRDALNAAFLGPAGHYRTDKDPGYRQTSNAIPLAFGLVPAGAEASVVKSLVDDIRARGDHLNTGALGTSVLLRVLSAHGYPDVAHAVAAQRTEPSWGYWLTQGADTMWEMWHKDSRSRDHYFQGTVTQWLYENVAGLRPGDAGYERFTVRPDGRVEVSWASAEIDTVRGKAASSWSLIGGDLRLDVDVPVGSTAEVHVPAARREDVVSTPAAEYVRSEPGFVVFRAGQGSWEFVARQ